MPECSHAKGLAWSLVTIFSSATGRIVWNRNHNELFCSAFMKKNQKPYSNFQLGSSLVMVLALLWLTISLPFVYASQQLAKANNGQHMGISLCGAEEETNPLGNTTEEKSSSSSFSEEYLHDHQHSDHSFSINTLYHKCENADTYTAFHGEVQVPPPNVA